MDDLPQMNSKREGSELVGFWAEHRFFILVFATIVISLVLVVISLVIYNVSGAAQLDLSRPGYQSVSNQVEREDSSDQFSPSGSVTNESINEFIKLYDDQARKTKSVDAFNGDPLNPELLEFSDETSE